MPFLREYVDRERQTESVGGREAGASPDGASQTDPAGFSERDHLGLT